MQSTRLRLIGAAALGLVLAGGAFAQDAPAPADQPADDAPTADAPATAGEAAPEAPAAEPAPAGEPAEGAEAAADTPLAEPEVLEIVRDTFGDWEVRCAPGGDDCFMYQLALDTDQNPVAEFSLLKLPTEAEATAGVTVVTPLGTLLPAGLVLQIDGGQARQYPFSWCSQVGCFARFGLDDPSIASLKRGRAGKMTLVSVAAPDDPLTLEVSLSGFTAAFDSLEVPAAETAPTPAPAN